MEDRVLHVWALSQNSVKHENLTQKLGPQHRKNNTNAFACLDISLNHEFEMFDIHGVITIALPVTICR